MSKVLRIIFVPIFVFAFLLLNGCASIVHGTSENETFNTIPNGADIMIDGVKHGKSPVTASLKRDKTHIVDVNLPGYQPAQLKLENTPSGWIAGNIVFGGVIGIVVDAVDGAMYKLSPAQLANVSNTQLQHISDESVTIVLAQEVPNSLRTNKIGQLNKAT